MKINKNMLLADCAEYWNSLSLEEKDWLWRFEMVEKYGMTPVGDPPPTKEELKLFYTKRGQRQRDILNKDPIKVLEHYHGKERKPRYGPDDYDWALTFNDQNDQNNDTDD